MFSVILQYFEFYRIDLISKIFCEQLAYALKILAKSFWGKRAKVEQPGQLPNSYNLYNVMKKPYQYIKKKKYDKHTICKRKCRLCQNRVQELLVLFLKGSLYSSIIIKE